MQSSTIADEMLEKGYARFITNSRKPVVFSTKGIVASSQHLASEAGLSILRSGGNAADAAIATAAALNVTEPCSCGIGGDVFAIFYNAKSRTISGLNGSGRSPQALTLSKARELGISSYGIPSSNINSVTVPGSAAAWVDVHAKWGSGKKTLLECLQPAIDLAEQGFPVSGMSAHEWKVAEEVLATRSKAGKEMLMPDGKAPRPGEVFSNPNLAKTFREVAEGGKKAFYTGRIAQAIVDVIQSQGGVMTLEDLSSHDSEFIQPISYTYGEEGVTVHEMPPNGQGLATLIALGIIDALRETGVVDISKLDHGSSEYYHVLIEAIRFALADVVRYVADMQKQKVPVEELLSKPYLRERAKLFNPKKAVPDLQPGDPHHLGGSDTVYFCLTDQEGNGVSFIMSNFSGFGNASVPEGCGFTLQNRGSGFALDETSPNCLEGGKRPSHTILPAMVTKGDELYAVFGVMGGNAQAQAQLQVLMNHLHHGHHPQSALDWPRFLVGGDVSYKVPSRTPFYNLGIALEEGIPQSVADELAAMGHKTSILSGHDRLAFGKGQMILKTADPRSGKLVWAAGSDPRGDGCALAQI